MGSSTDSLPEASSPHLILTVATPLERERIWSLTHRQWGGLLSHEAYLEREAYLRTVPLEKDGGITHWLLTDSTLPPDQRPILSSCDTYRKRALSCTPSGQVTDGIAHGIGAVFTDPQYRGKGYASRMLKELGSILSDWQAGEGGKPLFSVLYSDIGKSFYAKSGWAAFPSSHLAFPQVPGASTGLEPQNGYAAAEAKPIGYHELAELCAVDEGLLREALPRRAAQTAQTAVALLPDLDSALWHLMREDFIAKQVFGRTPAVKGAVYGEKGKRVWAVWTRGYYGEVGTLNILRLVVEDESAPDEHNAQGIKAVVQVAQAEAAEWRCREVQTWNPDERLRGLVEKSGLQFEAVDRDADSIASLMWYGKGRTEDIDWFYNEKYGWC